jgi:hypothetical protein
MRQEEIKFVVAVSFFLVLFLSLRRAVEMWKNPQADRALVTNIHPDHVDGYPETFEPGRGPEKGCILRCCPSRTRL